MFIFFIWIIIFNIFRVVMSQQMVSIQQLHELIFIKLKQVFEMISLLIAALFLLPLLSLHAFPNPSPIIPVLNIRWTRFWLSRILINQIPFLSLTLLSLTQPIILASCLILLSDSLPPSPDLCPLLIIIICSPVRFNGIQLYLGSTSWTLDI